MLTVLEVLNLSTDYLQQHGIESPRINAELLLASILNCKRLDLYLAFDKPRRRLESTGTLLNEEVSLNLFNTLPVQ
jgi:release factor glutamine methyltransferase